jgi:hypothetical protein
MERYNVFTGNYTDTRRNMGDLISEPIESIVRKIDTRTGKITTIGNNDLQITNKDTIMDTSTATVEQQNAAFTASLQGKYLNTNDNRVLSDYAEGHAKRTGMSYMDSLQLIVSTPTAKISDEINRFFSNCLDLQPGKTKAEGIATIQGMIDQWKKSQ